MWNKSRTFCFVFYLSCSCSRHCIHPRTHARTHTWTHARVIHCTNSPGGRKHCFFIALNGCPTFGTIFSGCRGFHIKWNISIESWIMRNWCRLVQIFVFLSMGYKWVLVSSFFQIFWLPLFLMNLQTLRWLWRFILSEIRDKWKKYLSYANSALFLFMLVWISFWESVEVFQVMYPKFCHLVKTKFQKKVKFPHF